MLNCLMRVLMFTLPGLATAAPEGAANPLSVATRVSAPASFTSPAVTTVFYSFTNAASVQHWRFRGEWIWDGSRGVGAGALQLVSAITVGAANYAASPGIYLLGGQTYTLAHRRAGELTASPYVIGYCPVQDDSRVTPITSLTMTNTDNYTTRYTNTFTVPTDGVYHLVFKQTPLINAVQPRDRFANISVTGPGAAPVPVGIITTGPSSVATRSVAAQRATLTMQLTTVIDSAGQLRRVIYAATNTATGSSTIVGESTSPTAYTAVWNDLPVGVYDIRARLLNAGGQGALTAAPLSLTVVPSPLSTASYLGGTGTDDVRAMVYQPDGTLVMAVNTTVNPAGVVPTLLAGATAASAGALIRLSGNGRQVLSLVRVATQIVDLATDAGGRLYIAAGSDGAFRLRADGTAIDWHKTYPGQYAHRIDAGPQGYSAVMVANDTNPDNNVIAGSVQLYVYTPTGTTQTTTGGVSQYTSDVVVDEASQTIIGTGHKNFNTPDPSGKTFPVYVPVIRAWTFGGVQKYVAYDWSADINSPRWLNRAENNMADVRATRASLGRDGKLYVLFEVNGGNHILRYDPFDNTLPAKIVGGDEYFNFANTNSEVKTFVGRYEPGTGAYRLGQQLTARISAANNPNNRRGNTINTRNGNVAADAEGRVFITGDAAFGAPQTIDYLPGQYTGGAYAIVLSPDLARREAAFRVALNKGRAVAALDATNWAYGGSTTDPLFYPVNALQSALSGGQDGFYAVTGGQRSCPMLYTIQAGNWTDPAVWSCRRIPTQADVVLIRHAVVVPSGTVARARRITYEAPVMILLQPGAVMQLP